MKTDKRIYNPLLFITGKAEYDRRIKRLEEFVYQILENREKEDSYEGKADFLSTLLHLKQTGEGQGITKVFLRDQLLNFLVAGRDTTAQLLTWVFYFLSQHPECQKKVYEEVLTQLPSETPTMENTKSLKYLDMVLNEALRLTPPAVPMNSRKVTADTTLPTGIKVRKGQLITYSPYVVHRLPEYWGNNAEEFIPERWEDPNILKHQYQFLPFQRGPRICLGMNMALEEAKSCICLIVQNGIYFKYIGERAPKPVCTPILHAKEGMPMKVIVSKN